MLLSPDALNFDYSQAVFSGSENTLNNNIAGASLSCLYYGFTKKGDAVASAGHIVVHNGILKALNAQTGHYKILANYNNQILD